MSEADVELDVARREYDQSISISISKPGNRLIGADAGKTNGSVAAAAEAKAKEVSDTESATDGDDSDMVRKTSQIELSVSAIRHLLGAPERGHTFRVDWRDLLFSVQTKTEERKVLRGVSGVARSGRMLGILGASGAGKTSLLNVLAGRLRSHDNMEVYGEVLVNGADMSRKEFRKVSAYVMQDDALMETMTPREALLFSAQLRLPETMSLDAKRERVESIIEVLGIAKCADTYIGGNHIRGISGGERKRLSIGIELITNPTILFADEPTSGLDSHTATQCVRCLQQLAHSGRTVIATIHQPNSMIYEMFDDLMIMGEGEIMYLGPREGAVDYFAGLGYKCPPYMNPADYLVAYMQGTADADKERRVRFAGECRENLIAPILAEEMTEEDESESLKKGSPGESQASSSDIGGATKPGSLVQLQLLSKRAFLNYTRQPLTSKLRLAQQFFFALIVGLLFFQVDRSARAVQARVGALFFCTMQSAFGVLMSVILTFPVERTMFQRERANGMYSTSAYFVSKIACELPFQVIYVGIFVIIAYPTIDFGPTAEQGFKYYLTLVSVAMLAYSLGILVGSAVSSPEGAMAGAPFVMIPFVLFSGFFINTEDIAVWIRWVSYISWFKYAIEALIINEFGGEFIVEGCENGTSAMCQFQNGQEVLQFYGLDDTTFWESWIVVVGMMGFYFLLGYALLHRNSQQRSSRPLEKKKLHDE